MYRVSLVTPTEELVLRGLGTTAPIKDARQTAGAISGLEQVLAFEVRMEGLPADLRACQDALARLLRCAADGLDLQITPHSGAAALSARVLAAQIEAVGAGSHDRARGSLTVKLNLRCAAGWEAAEVELPLRQGGAAVSGGLSVMNHVDGGQGHLNYVDIAAGDLRGDAAGALRLEMTNCAATNLGDVWVCLNAWGSPADFQHILEGEAGTGGSVVMQGGCSGGALRRVSVSASESTLLAWALDQTQLAQCAGRVFRPLVRLAAAPVFTDVWLWWQVQLNGAVLWESPRDVLESGKAVQELPPLRLLPGSIANPRPLEVCLRGVGAAGSYNLDVDFLQLCPLDGWRHYRAAAGVAPGETLVDDGFSGRVSTRASSGQALSHAVQGAPLLLPPGQAARLIFLHTGGVEDALMVRAFYRPRWKEV